MKHFSKIEPSGALKEILEEAKTAQCTCRVGNYDPNCAFMLDREWREVEEWLLAKQKENERTY